MPEEKYLTAKQFYTFDENGMRILFSFSKAVVLKLVLKKMSKRTAGARRLLGIEFTVVCDQRQ